MDCNIYVSSKPQGNHKTKTYNRYTQDKEKGTKYTTMENHQFTKEDSKRGRKELHNSQKTMNKMAIVSPFLSIITLNGLSAAIKRHRVNG